MLVEEGLIDEACSLHKWMAQGATCVVEGQHLSKGDCGCTMRMEEQGILVVVPTPPFVLFAKAISMLDIAMVFL